jgi:uncharacterized membrane protein HdeD (DUF308 family)
VDVRRDNAAPSVVAAQIWAGVECGRWLARLRRQVGRMSTYVDTGERDRGTARSPMEVVARHGWMWLVGLGIAAVAIGVIVLAWPNQTIRVVGILFGIYLLVSGVIEIMVAFAPEVRTSVRILSVLAGALSILLGLLCFRGALESILLLALWIGFGWLITGITRAVGAASAPVVPHRGWQIFGGILIAIAGIVVITSPISSIQTLTVLVGIWLVVVGAWQVIEAFVLRRRIREVAPTY